MWVQSVDTTALDISNSVLAPTDIGKTFQAHQNHVQSKLDGNTEGKN